VLGRTPLAVVEIGVNSLESLSITLPSAVKVARARITGLATSGLGFGVNVSCHEPASDVVWATMGFTPNKAAANMTNTITNFGFILLFPPDSFLDMS
jgi:hypothetical protein